jgi:hypothetical protein
MPRLERARDAKNRQLSSGAAAGSRELTSRVYLSVPVTTARVEGLTSTAMITGRVVDAVNVTTLS